MFTDTDVELTCHVTSVTPPTSCYWSRDGVTMTTSAPVTSGDEHTCTTVVSGIQESSKYACSIESGDASNEIQLNVIGTFLHGLVL